MQINKKQADLKTIFYYWWNNVATNTMVSQETGVPQKSICRYKRDLELKGLLFELEKKPCKVTKKLAWFNTTNPELFLKYKSKSDGNG